MRMRASYPSKVRYRIRVRGHLSADWSVWFAGLTMTNEEDGTTLLEGCIPDQAALYGLLSRLRDLGALLLTLEYMA